MPFLVVAAALLGLQSGNIDFDEAVVIGNVAAGGRIPIPQDAILAKLVDEPNFTPSAGDSVLGPDGRKQVWKVVHANKDGALEDRALRGGYAFATVPSAVDSIMLLNASGDSFVYVNGEIRAGDPYSYGYLKIPVRLKAGGNTFLFNVGRGSLKAHLETPRGPQQLETADLTAPDILPTDHRNLFGSVVVLNSSLKWARSLKIVATAGNRALETSVPPIMPLSLRKVRFGFPAGAGLPEIKLALAGGSKILDRQTIELRVRKPFETHKRTFVSEIDGSVQYYAVNPAQKPSPRNALVMTLHGAGVEAIGQVQAYKSKDWVTLIGPTNRRPYGFDWESVGREDALEVLGIAKRTVQHDPSRVFLTGHSMGGHGTWAIGTMYPDLFGVIAPSAGWISFWTYGGGWNPKNPTQQEDILRRSLNAGDTLMRLHNTVSEAVYVLHGGADDNVPVQQARRMKDLLEPWHPDFTYHEQPGAGHWWGDQCVDWPPIFDEFQTRRLDLDPSQLDFTTANPAVSGKDRWAEILQQQVPLAASHIRLRKGKAVDGVVTISGIAENVQQLRFQVPRDAKRVELDLGGSRTVTTVPGDGELTAELRAGNWVAYHPPRSEKNDLRSGPFKQVFDNRFEFVYGTHGTAEENAWAFNKARYDQESFYYRGNGSVDVLSDDEYLRSRGAATRNAIFYGKVNRTLATRYLSGADMPKAGPDQGLVMVRPVPRNDAALAGFIIPAGRATETVFERLGLFTSGVAYPDWMVVGAGASVTGSKGVIGAGFFDNQWRLLGNSLARIPATNRLHIHGRKSIVAAD